MKHGQETLATVPGTEHWISSGCVHYLHPSSQEAGLLSYFFTFFPEVQTAIYPWAFQEEFLVYERHASML